MAKRLRSQQDWQQLVASWKASGKSIQQFCKEHGLATSSFWHWKDRLAKPNSDTAIFLPVKVTSAPGRHFSDDNHDGSVEIVVAGRYQVRVAGYFGSGLLDRVITVLEERAC